jgi:hypothetical protein
MVNVICGIKHRHEDRKVKLASHRLLVTRFRMNGNYTAATIYAFIAYTRKTLPVYT